MSDVQIRQRVDLSWQARGKCVGMDPDQFFPPPHTPQREIDRVKAICAACPVVEECREYGIRNEKGGLWGGLSELERRNIRRVRRRTLGTRWRDQ